MKLQWFGSSSVFLFIDSADPFYMMTNVMQIKTLVIMLLGSH